jgi:uncharacterized protein YbjQ (UPF0145 family)
MSQHQAPPPADPFGGTQLPPHARERLAEMKAKKLFTSDLSVSEFLLVKQAGFEPLGLVMGTSIYQIVPQLPRLQRGQPGAELIDMTRALYHARDLAMTRMEQEAHELGADGIIGVRIEVNLNTDPARVSWQQYREWTEWAREMGMPRPVGGVMPGMPANWLGSWPQIAWQQWTLYCQRMGIGQRPPPWAMPRKQVAFSLGQNVAEFIAIGTAVKHRGGENFTNNKGRPFQSDLNGQEFWTLIQAGYRPVGFVMGNCVYYVPPEMIQARASKSYELTGYTHALYDARELAIERLQWEAEALGATGIVGVTVSEQEHAWRPGAWTMATPMAIGNAALQTGELIELFVLGTAVVPMSGEGMVRTAAKTTMVLSANDKQKPTHGVGGAKE